MQVQREDSPSILLDHHEVRFACALLAAVLAIVVLGMPDRTAGQWDDVSRILDTNNMTTTDIAIEDGRVYVVADGAYTHDGTWLSCLDGDVWSPWELVNEGCLTTPTYPRIEVEDGVIHVVWQDSLDYGGDIDVHYRRCVNGTWDPVMDLASDDDPYILHQMPEIDVDGSEVHAIWRQLDVHGGAKEGVFYRHFDGSHWDAPVRLDRPGLDYPPMYPRIAVDGDNIHVVWIESRGGNWDTYYKRFDGSRWLDPVEISSDLYWGQGQGYPEIAAAQGTVHVVWCNDGSPTRTIYRCAVDGVWQEAIALGTGTSVSDQLYPAIAAEGDVAFAAWFEREIGTGTSSIYLRFFDGMKWGPEQEIGDRTDVYPAFSNLVIAVEGGAVSVSWSRRPSPDYNPYPVYRGGLFEGAAPTSSAGPLGSPWLDPDGTQVPWTATDDYCLANVSLLYSYSADNATWSDWAPALSSGAIAGTEVRGSFLFVPPAGDGFYRLGTVSVDISGRREALAPAGDLSAMLDTAPPEGSITINGGDAWTTDPNVVLTLTFSDTMTDIISRSTGRSLLQVGLSMSLIGDSWPWEEPSPERAWDLGPMQGKRWVFYIVRDLAGLASGIYEDDILLDTAPPTGSVEIRAEENWTTSPSVMLRVTYQDATSGVAGMRVSNDGVWDDEPWGEPFWDIEWALSDGDGPKTVYFQVVDLCGLMSPVYQDSILLDTTPPTCSITIDDGADFTGSRQVVLHIEVQDATMGPDLMRLTDQSFWSGDGWEPLSREVVWFLTEGSGEKTVSLQARDLAGLVSETCSDSILLDSEPPVGSVIIAGDAGLVNSTQVELTIHCSDPTTTVEAMQVGDDGAWDDEPWVPAAGSLRWSLPGGDGVKVVYLRLRDAVGHVSATYLDEVTLDTTPPTVTSVSPGDGATGLPTALTITIDLSEPVVGGPALAGTVEVLLDGKGVAGDVALSPDGRTLTFRPTGPLAEGSTYGIVVGTGLKDVAGNAMGSSFMSNFTTGGRGGGGGGDGGGGDDDGAVAPAPLLAALALITILTVAAWAVLRTRRGPRTPS